MHSKLLYSHKIVFFDPSHQNTINLFMQEIQLEFSENFSSPNAKSITELVEKDGDLFWTALYQDQAIGTIGLSRFDEHTAILKRLFLHPQHRGKEFRIAEQLLNVLIREAKQLGFRNIYLGTMKQFAAAQKFYEKNGFIRIRKEELPAGMNLSPLDTIFYTFALKA